MKNVFVYRLKKLAEDPDSGGYSDQLKVHRWNPGLTRFIPPNSSLPYIYFWFMHYLRVFKSRDYCAYVIFEQNKPVCSLVCVPSLYRWPFMNPGDLQIKNVFTSPDHRGRGYASQLVYQVINELGIGNREYWYMTDEENIPSQKLCQKIGFEYMGRYRRRRNKYFFYEGEIFEVQI